MNSPALPCDLTDAELALLEPLLPSTTEGRPPRWPRRSLLNALFYLVRTGCAWRLLPPHYPPWKTAYSTFRLWRLTGKWEALHTTVRELLRRAEGREACPQRALLDSQSVKTADRGGPEVGYDGPKKVHGRNATSSRTPEDWFCGWR